MTTNVTEDNSNLPENSNRPDSSADTLSSGFTSAKRVGLIIAFLVFGVFGVWASTAPLESASHAQGSVAARSHNKVVQHLEGGIISEILVENGDVVAEGDVLLRLDTTQSRSELERVNAQLTTARAREARLLAERDGLEQIRFPEDVKMDAEVRSERESQRQIFEARRQAHQGGIDVLEQRIQQLRSRLTGLRAMHGSKEELLQSYATELEEVQGLLADGFSDTERLRSVERNHATLRGEVAQLASDISSAEEQISETRMEIEQQRREFRSEVVSQLGETRSQLKDLRARRTALQDVLERKTVRAPAAGIVNGMEVHTVGGVIGPGDQIAEIVPEGDELIIEARVSPIDIDRVEVGQEATVRFTSFSRQTVPSLTGNVINVSADAMTDQESGQTYYRARIGVEPDELDQLGNLTLVPGMPAEVFIS